MKETIPAPSPSHPEARLQVVDLVRSFSILAVMAIHLAGPQNITKTAAAYWENLIWYKLWVSGSFGVSAFFVISGFLITQLLASRPGGLFHPDLRDFYARRFGRIVPLLVLTCLIGAVMILFFPSNSRAFETCYKNHPDGSFSPFYWASLSVFCFNWYKIFADPASLVSGLHWDVLWSLSIEEQFYFLYPWLLRALANRRNLALVLLAFIALGPLSTLVLGHFLPPDRIPGQNSFAGFHLIAMGCLLYLLSEKLEKTLVRNGFLSASVCLTGFLIFFSAYTHQEYKADFMGHLLIPSLIGLGVFLFLLGGLRLDLFTSKLLAPLAWPGRLSYGGYLLHVTVLYFLWPSFKDMDEFTAFGLFSLATFLLAALSYRFYEMPLNRTCRRVLGGRAGA